MRMKEEPEVEEEEEEEEEEEKAKEEHEKEKLEAGSSRLQQETGPEAAPEMSLLTDLSCPKEAKNHGNMFPFLPVLFSGTFALTVGRFEKGKPVLACAF